MTISGRFFANCMFIFHKIEIQTVILMCLIGSRAMKLLAVKVFFFMPENAPFQGTLPRNDLLSHLYWGTQRTIKIS